MNDTVVDCDVAVIGAGPSGLGLATRLRQLGVERVTVLERETDAGGIPRHCGHSPFGMREFRRVLTGPRYARHLVQAAMRAGVEILTGTTVVAVRPGPELDVTNSRGITVIRARRIVLATGARETPRAARLVSGDRPAGVITTGTLQSMVYLKGRTPLLRPVIAGSELISFSAIATCRYAGIRPAAMVEENDRVTAFAAAAWYPRLTGVELLTGTRIESIEGRDRVDGVVVVDRLKRRRRIACDGVVFSGRFVPESALVRMGHLEIDRAGGGPVTDPYFRCSDPAYFAIGNLIHPAESAGACWREGVAAARHVLRGLRDELPRHDPAVAVIHADPAIRYVLPQRLPADPRAAGEVELRVRFAAAGRGRLIVEGSGHIVATRRVHALPERTARIRLERLPQCAAGNLAVRFDTV